MKIKQREDTTWTIKGMTESELQTLYTLLCHCRMGDYDHTGNLSSFHDMFDYIEADAHLEIGQLRATFESLEDHETGLSPSLQIL
jgi:hypothetical protein